MRSYVRALTLTNFRGFKGTGEIPLAPLTFVVGPNSSGKSSLSDALLLLAQSRFAPVGSFVPRWNAPLIDLGSYKDTVYAHKPRLRIGISIKVAIAAPEWYIAPRPVTELSEFQVDYELRVSKPDPVGILESVRVTDLLSAYNVTVSRTGKFRVQLILDAGETQETIVLRAQDLEHSIVGSWPRVIRDRLRSIAGKELRPKSLTVHQRALRRLQAVFSTHSLEPFLYGIERVSSGRGGPQRWYSIGARGKGALFDTVDPSVLVPTDDGRSQRRARKAFLQLQGEMAAALSKLGIADQITSSSISPYHAAIEVRDSITKIPSNLMEVGFGASQALPVIRACLSRSEGALFVEQPEIHLHPRAQGEIAELICDTSKRRQVIVETHSAHMINRARLRIARKEMEASEVMIIYVSRDREGSHAFPIPLDEQGDFTQKWPDGFFEERYEDTKKLLKLRHSPKTAG